VLLLGTANESHARATRSTAVCGWVSQALWCVHHATSRRSRRGLENIIAAGPREKWVLRGIVVVFSRVFLFFLISDLFFSLYAVGLVLPSAGPCLSLVNNVLGLPWFAPLGSPCPHTERTALYLSAGTAAFTLSRSCLFCNTSALRRTTLRLNAACYGWATW